MNSSNNWTLMSTHGIVLFYIAANPDKTMREMSESLGVTERRIAQVVRELSDAELLRVQRNGRRNIYSVNANAGFQHPMLSHVTVGKFAEVVSGTL